jgi:hypothetical protein
MNEWADPVNYRLISAISPPTSLVFTLDGKEVCRFEVVDGALDIKVPPDLPMTRAARTFLATCKEAFGLP